jgi:hypothetical protein
VTTFWAMQGGTLNDELGFLCVRWLLAVLLCHVFVSSSVASSIGDRPSVMAPFHIRPSTDNICHRQSDEASERTTSDFSVRNTDVSLSADRKLMLARNMFQVLYNIFSCCSSKHIWKLGQGYGCDHMEAYKAT